MEIIPYDPPRSYARASRVGDLVFIAGEVGRDDHGHLVTGGIVEQSTQAFDNIGDTLETMGLGFADLVRMDVFLLDEADTHPFLDVMRRYLPDGSPPGAMLCVKGFSHPGMLVEIECIAAARS